MADQTFHLGALNVLRDVGITVGRFDASEYDPADKEHAAAYNQWLATEIQEAIDDPRPNIAHDEVMAELDATIATLWKKKRA